MSQPLNVNVLNYPIILFSDETFKVVETSAELTTVPMTAVNGTWFQGMLIVELTGRSYVVEKARSLGNAGWTWIGPFPTRNVHIELHCRESNSQLSVDDVRAYIYASKIRLHGLESRTDFDDIKRDINKASTISDIIDVFM